MPGPPTSSSARKTWGAVDLADVAAGRGGFKIPGVLPGGYMGYGQTADGDRRREPGRAGGRSVGVTTDVFWPGPGSVGRVRQEDDRDRRSLGSEARCRGFRISPATGDFGLGGSASALGDVNGDGLANFDDEMFGDRGNDTLRGGAGADRISGGHDRDLICGGTGDDVLAGDRGDDRVYGGKGSDLLVDGTGIDILNGGPGEDIYCFVVDGRIDYAKDFGPGDLIDLGLWDTDYSELRIRDVPCGFVEVSIEDDAILVRGDGLDARDLGSDRFIFDADTLI